MKLIATSLQNHFEGDEVSTAICWTVEKKTGGTIRGTDHDRNVVITTGPLAGTYLSFANLTGSDVRTSSDMSVDNMEVETISVDSPNDGITFAEIEAGALNNARVTVFTCNWQEPDDGQVILRRGYMGSSSSDTDFGLRNEVRGLTQILAQQIGRVLSDRCDVVRFGDERCGFDVSSVTGDGTISAVTNNRVFTMSVSGVDPAWPYMPLGGEITFTSGENAGFTKEVKSAVYASGSLAITLFEEMPGDVLVGDGIEFIAGCDRLYTTCRYYDNLVNFRGHGFFVPGMLAMMRGATIGECTIALPPDIEA